MLEVPGSFGIPALRKRHRKRKGERRQRGVSGMAGIVPGSSSLSALSLFISAMWSSLCLALGLCLTATAQTCASTYGPVVSLDSDCDYDATSSIWTSTGSAGSITMDTTGMALDSSMGPLFDDGNGRQIDYNGKYN
jgi:hypothetical protein